jgi:hypothetical protein
MVSMIVHRYRTSKIVHLILCASIVGIMSLNAQVTLHHRLLLLRHHWRLIHDLMAIVVYRVYQVHGYAMGIVIVRMVRMSQRHVGRRRVQICVRDRGFLNVKTIDVYRDHGLVVPI